MTYSFGQMFNLTNFLNHVQKYIWSFEINIIYIFKYNFNLFLPIVLEADAPNTFN